jgi:hypothetical protein
VQKLTCQISSLNQFILKLAERSLPFFAILRGSAKIEWGAEQQKVFDDLKGYLEQLPTLSSLEWGQPLILYVLAMHSAVNRALVTEKEITQNGKTTVLSVFHFRGPHGVQDVPFRDGEIFLCCHHECMQSFNIILKHTQSGSQPVNI